MKKCFDLKNSPKLSSSPPLMTSQAKVIDHAPLPPNQHRAPMPCTTTHARCGLPVGQMHRSTPANIATSALHDTAAIFYLAPLKATLILKFCYQIFTTFVELFDKHHLESSLLFQVLICVVHFLQG